MCRWLSLAGLQEVVWLCEPMAHQHAIHIVAAVVRLYLLLLLSPPVEGREGVGRVRDSCTSVCVAVQRACGAGKPGGPGVDVVGFLTSLVEGGARRLQPLVTDVQQRLVVTDQQAPERPGPAKSVVQGSDLPAAATGGGGRRVLIQELS